MRPRRSLSPPEGEAEPAGARRARKNLQAAAADTVREIWRVTSLLRSAFVQAVLPFRLADIPRILPEYVAHLKKYADGKIRGATAFRDAIAGIESQAPG